MAESAVPDVLAPGLHCIFCGINPGFRSAAAAAHFANPRNDFWRLLADADLTPRVLVPEEQWEMLGLGYGLTNAAYRTTKGSGDLAPRRLRRLRRAVRAPSEGARAAGDRVRGQVGLRGRLPRAARARAAGAPPGRDAAVRPPLDLAGQRGRALRGEAPLVSRPSRRARGTRHIRARGVSWGPSRSRRRGGWHDPPTNARSICRGWNDDRTDLDGGGGSRPLVPVRT